VHPYEQEERDAWFSRHDRFDGFDRGDVLECPRDPRPIPAHLVDPDIPF
jgi:hypothetical protein